MPPAASHGSACAPIFARRRRRHPGASAVEHRTALVCLHKFCHPFLPSLPPHRILFRRHWSTMPAPPGLPCCTHVDRLVVSLISPWARAFQKQSSSHGACLSTVLCVVGASEANFVLELCSSSAARWIAAEGRRADSVALTSRPCENASCEINRP